MNHSLCFFTDMLLHECRVITEHCAPWAGKHSQWWLILDKMLSLVQLPLTVGPCEEAVSWLQREANTGEPRNDGCWTDHSDISYSVWNKKTTNQTLPASRLWAMARAVLTFWVITPAARPYVVLLARSTTSSMSLNLRMDCTGPNICNTQTWLVPPRDISLGQHPLILTSEKNWFYVSV